MAKIYFAKLELLLAEDDLGAAEVEVKHFFNGAAGYVVGRICMSWTPAGLALKLPQSLLDQLFTEKNGTPLRYFPNAPIKKEYAVLSVDLVTDRAKLRPLLNECLKYVASQSEARK